MMLPLLIIVTGPLDLGLVGRGVAPAWFGRLRMVLSLAAGAGLLATRRPEVQCSAEIEGETRRTSRETPSDDTVKFEL